MVAHFSEKKSRFLFCFFAPAQQAFLGIEYTAAPTRTSSAGFTTHWTSNLSGMRYRARDRGDRCRHSCRNRHPANLKHSTV